jgi:hypothetical protein
MKRPAAGKCPVELEGRKTRYPVTASSTRPRWAESTGLCSDRAAASAEHTFPT